MRTIAECRKIVEAAELQLEVWDDNEEFICRACKEAKIMPHWIAIMWDMSNKEAPIKMELMQPFKQNDLLYFRRKKFESEVEAYRAAAAFCEEDEG